MISIAILDVDRTITRRPTYTLFLLHAMRRIAPWRALLVPVLLPVGAAYAAGLIRRETMKEAMHWVALGGGVPHHRADRVADEFAERVFRSGLYHQALSLIADKRKSGHQVILATAAPELYIRPLARLLGIEHVVATRAVARTVAGDDHLTWRISGANCYGPVKLAMIQAALADAGIDRSQAHVSVYTDHHSDRHICEWADAAFAVNPSPKMAALAAQRGWQILDWRAD